MGPSVALIAAVLAGGCSVTDTMVTSAGSETASATGDTTVASTDEVTGSGSGAGGATGTSAGSTDGGTSGGAGEGDTGSTGVTTSGADTGSDTTGADPACDPLVTEGLAGTLGSAGCWACIEEECGPERFYCGCLTDLAPDGCRAAAEVLASVDCKVVDEFVCLLVNGGPFGGKVGTDGAALLGCADMRCAVECGGAPN